ncbi:MAG: hypothetical protein STSR0009_29900 [Methanoregula sp.]
MRAVVQQAGVRKAKCRPADSGNKHSTIKQPAYHLQGGSLYRIKPGICSWQHEHVAWDGVDIPDEDFGGQV